jgi:hypothetical protein
MAQVSVEVINRKRLPPSERDALLPENISVIQKCFSFLQKVNSARRFFNRERRLQNHTTVCVYQQELFLISLKDEDIPVLLLACFQQ